MKKSTLWIEIIMVMLVLLEGCNDISPDLQSAPSEYPTPDINPVVSPIPTLSPIPTGDPEQTELPALTVLPTGSPTGVPTELPEQTVTPTPQESPTGMPIEMPEQTITPTPPESPTGIPIELPEQTATPAPPEQTETPTSTGPPTSAPTESPVESPIPASIPGPDEIIITEIMYNPKSPDGEWEWIEIYNTSTTEIDLSGWVIDDGNKTPHSAANILSGRIPPGRTGILFNSDNILPGEFLSVWGQEINLIPVINWGAMGLNNSGDKIGIWTTFSLYEGDHELFENTCCYLDYSDRSLWPGSDGNGSLYLADINGDYTNGNNWMLSSEGTLTPLGPCYQSLPGGTNTGKDIGSPISVY